MFKYEYDLQSGRSCDTWISNEKFESFDDALEFGLYYAALRKAKGHGILVELRVRPAGKNEQ